jgi:uncharacterized protein (UPF0332 family)
MSMTSFDWTRFRDLGEELTRRQEEVAHRTAIGRLYYYVFHLARQRVIQNGFHVLAGVDSHKQVWEKYTNSPEPECQKLGEIAKRLKERRVRADYSDTYVRVKEDAAQVLEDTQMFADKLSRLSPRLPANSGYGR